jgi:hypothetical protein
MPRAYVLFSVGSGSEDQVRKDIENKFLIKEPRFSLGLFYKNIHNRQKKSATL